MSFVRLKRLYMQGESVVRAVGWVTKEPDMCIQDQSASSFLSGSEYILRYLKWLEVQGYPRHNFLQEARQIFSIWRRCRWSCPLDG